MIVIDWRYVLEEVVKNAHLFVTFFFAGAATAVAHELRSW